MSNLLISSLQELIDDSELFGADAPCPVLHERGHPDSRILLISGENAGGKSFACKYLRQLVREEKIEIMDGGMHRRTQAGIQRAFMYGDEGWESTGQISLKFVLTGLRTCKSRETPHVFMLDEPDTGLSDGYQVALGQLLADFGKDLPDDTKALVVVSHSRPLIERMMALRPHALRVGDDLRPTAQWLADGALPRSLAELETLGTRSVERFRAINKIIDARKQARRKDS